MFNRKYAFLPTRVLASEWALNDQGVADMLPCHLQSSSARGVIIISVFHSSHFTDEGTEAQRAQWPIKKFTQLVQGRATPLSISKFMSFSRSHTWSQWIINNASRGSFYYTHFADGKAEPQRVKQYIPTWDSNPCPLTPQSLGSYKFREIN